MKIISESKNFVLFKDLNEEETLYEKVFNTIHNAKKEGIKSIIKKLEKYNKKIRFRKLNLDQILENQFDTLALNITENCNLRCGYCIYSGIYEGERTHSSNKMNSEIALRATNEFIHKSIDEPHIMYLMPDCGCPCPPVVSAVPYVAFSPIS